MLQLIQVNVKDGEEISSYENFISINQVDILDDVSLAFGSLNISSLNLILPFLILVTRKSELDDLNWCRCKAFEVKGCNQEIILRFRFWVSPVIRKYSARKANLVSLLDALNLFIRREVPIEREIGMSSPGAGGSRYKEDLLVLWHMVYVW